MQFTSRPSFCSPCNQWESWEQYLCSLWLASFLSLKLFALGVQRWQPIHTDNVGYMSYFGSKTVYCALSSSTVVPAQDVVNPCVLSEYNKTTLDTNYVKLPALLDCVLYTSLICSRSRLGALPLLRYKSSSSRSLNKDPRLHSWPLSLSPQMGLLLLSLSMVISRPSP